MWVPIWPQSYQFRIIVALGHINLTQKHCIELECIVCQEAGKLIIDNNVSIYAIRARLNEVKYKYTEMINCDWKLNAFFDYFFYHLRDVLKLY